MMMKLAFASLVGAAALIMALSPGANRSSAVAEPVAKPQPVVEAAPALGNAAPDQHFLFVPSGEGTYKLAGDESTTINVER